jgi:hypothetical protein
MFRGEEVDAAAGRSFAIESGEFAASLRRQK